MGSIVNPDLKSGIKINGVDAFDIHPDTVKDIINSDETGIVRDLFQSKLDDLTAEMFPSGIPEDYAKAYGRPSLKDVPFGGSENDGYSYIPGHAPNCSGPDDHYVGGCWCAQFTSTRDHITGYNFHNKPMWKGGPDMDDFDM